MKRWDDEERSNERDRQKNPRYRIDLTKEGIRLVDLYTGSMRYGSWDGKAFGGTGKARDFQLDGVKCGECDTRWNPKKAIRELKDKENEFYHQYHKMSSLEREEKYLIDRYTKFINENFLWEEICRFELGIGYIG